MLSPELTEAIQRALSSGSAEGFQAVLNIVLRRFGAEMGMIHWLNATEGHLELVATSHGIPEPVLAASRRIPLGKGIAGATAQSGKPVSICNLQTDTSGVARPGARATGAQGALCVPVFLANQVVGTLGVGVRGERTFSEAETEELLTIGRELAAPLARGHA
jgi:signal transduction protein with GAF and PtsI domain